MFLDSIAIVYTIFGIAAFVGDFSSTDEIIHYFVSQNSTENIYIYRRNRYMVKTLFSHSLNPFFLIQFVHNK